MSNIVWYKSHVTKKDRCAILNQHGIVVWLTGISGSGKSTIAVNLEKKLFNEHRLTYILDGDNLRHGLNASLGFSYEDRIENVRRVGEVAQLMQDAGIITLVSVISPYRAQRDALRKQIPSFLEIYVYCPLEECIKRDPKGLYKLANNGTITNFTGIHQEYEPPLNPDLMVDTSKKSVAECVDYIYNHLKSINLI